MSVSSPHDFATRAEALSPDREKLFEQLNSLHAIVNRNHDPARLSTVVEECLHKKDRDALYLAMYQAAVIGRLCNGRWPVEAGKRLFGDPQVTSAQRKDAILQFAHLRGLTPRGVAHFDRRFLQALRQQVEEVGSGRLQSLEEPLQESGELQFTATADESELFARMRQDLTERDEELFYGVNRLYFAVGSTSAAELRQLILDHLTLKDRERLYFVMYQVCIIARRWMLIADNPEAGRQAFENPGVSSEHKRMALVRFAYQQKLTEQDWPMFEEQFNKGLLAKVEAEARQKKAQEQSQSLFSKWFSSRKCAKQSSAGRAIDYFVDRKTNLLEREEALFQGLNRIYWQLHQISNGQQLSALLEEGLTVEERSHFYFVMYRASVIAGYWDNIDRIEAGREAFEHRGIAIEFKQLALVQFAFERGLIAQQYPDFDKQFNEGLKAKARAEAEDTIRS